MAGWKALMENVREGKTGPQTHSTSCLIPSIGSVCDIAFLVNFLCVSL